MLSNYMTMDARWFHKGEPNEYGEASYTETPIKCRLVDKTKEIVDSKGNKVVSNSVIQCFEPIKVGDKINGKRIESVNPMTMLDCVAGYRGYLV